MLGNLLIEPHRLLIEHLLLTSKLTELIELLAAGRRKWIELLSTELVLLPELLLRSEWLLLHLLTTECLLTEHLRIGDLRLLHVLTRLRWLQHRRILPALLSLHVLTLQEWPLPKLTEDIGHHWTPTLHILHHPVYRSPHNLIRVSNLTSTEDLERVHATIALRREVRHPR